MSILLLVPSWCQDDDPHDHHLLLHDDHHLLPHDDEHLLLHDDHHLLLPRWCTQIRDFGLQHICGMRNLHILSVAGKIVTIVIVNIIIAIIITFAMIMTNDTETSHTFW